MSIQYDKEIFSSESLILKVNYSGIKDSIASATDLTMSMYAFDKDTGAPKFSETLNFEQIKGLYEQLNQISIVKDSTQTISGKFIETTDGVLDIINGLKDVDLGILKTILGKLNAGERIKGILKYSDEGELDIISALLKHGIYQTEIENLEILLQLEEAGNIVEEIKKCDDLKLYQAGQPEKIFQKWIEKNWGWVFGVEYLRRHDARKIGMFNEGDLLMESMDGFLDLIELKRPGQGCNIFNYDNSHKCHYPSSDLSKTIGQCLCYLQVLDNYKPNLEREYKVKVLRPRIKIILGRTNNFKDDQFEALRMLNSNLNHIQIISYDYLISCGRKILSIIDVKEDDINREVEGE